MDSIIGQLLTLGPGYIMAGVLFYILMKTKEEHMEERKQSAAELVRLSERQQLIEEKSQLIAIEYNKVLQEVRSSVESLAGLSRIEKQLQSIQDAQSQAHR